jgi:hypothetical protein
MIPESPKSNAVRILKDPFQNFDTFSQFSEDFSAENPQVEESEDP